ncbi:MAG: TetR/AcrR family transcriptional regulator [Bacteroidales bacterium]|nr:TetR/AcrR family transcriptional regulator [Bacteroidales bacterium]
MSPRTKQQYEELREERIAQIVEAALELFANKGYEGTSISQIAKEANMSKGLMYNYFNSKEALLKYILDNVVDEMTDLFDPNHDGILELHEMKGFIIDFFKLLKEKRHFYHLYFQVALQPTVFKLIEKRIEDMLKPLIEMTTVYFTEMGFENPVAEALIFGSIMDGAAFDYVLKPDLFPIEILQEELIKRYCTKKSK